MAFPTLVLGDLDLTDYSGLQYGISLIAEGTSRGAPVPIEVAVKSWLQDGSVVVTQGYDNRTVPLRVRLQGPDLMQLAEAEAALFAELGKPNLLTWTPPDGYGPPSVFVVVTSSMEESPGPSGDLAEARSYPWRTYNLRLVCEAFVRSETEVIVAALAASGTTTTLVDNGSATTNWTGSIDGVSSSPSVVSGAVGVTSGSVVGTTVLSLTRTASITTPSTKFLAIDYRPTSGSYVQNGLSQPLSAFADGVALPLIARTVLSTGLYRATFFVEASSVAALRVDLTVKGVAPGPFGGVDPAQVRTFFIDNINRTDIRPSVGTTRQLARTVELEGSAPAPGSLSISHATNALGDTHVYVWSDPESESPLYTPGLRQYAVTTGTPDAALVSGARVSLSNGALAPFDVPAAGLPGGRYVVLARSAAQAGSFGGGYTWYAKTKINATDIDTEQSWTAAAAFTTAYAIHPVARLNLPLTDVRDISTATIRLTLQNSSGPGNSIYLDEVWLYNLSLGQLIWVDCGSGAAASGGPSRRLFIDPPTVDRPRPVVLRGHATDGSDAFYANIKAWGQPRLIPSRMNMYTVTTNATDADVQVKYFPRWHSHAAR